VYLSYCTIVFLETINISIKKSLFTLFSRCSNYCILFRKELILGNRKRIFSKEYWISNFRNVCVVWEATLRLFLLQLYYCNIAFILKHPLRDEILYAIKYLLYYIHVLPRLDIQWLKNKKFLKRIPIYVSLKFIINIERKYLSKIILIILLSWNVTPSYLFSYKIGWSDTIVINMQTVLPLNRRGPLLWTQKGYYNGAGSMRLCRPDYCLRWQTIEVYYLLSPDQNRW